MSSDALPELDQVVHAPIRLATLSVLITMIEADFTFLKDRIGTTDGNLSTHLGKLEEAQYIKIEKKFVDKKPKTLLSITPKGKAAFLRYVSNLKMMIGNGDSMEKVKRN